ncbi:type 4 pilus major pilin [Pseudoxanthomonas winnipegensis]|nr:type 4 pilus major pilin [Pseudoxanthomonas winnipegensis]
MTPQARPSRRPPAPGFGLVELLLALGVATAMGAAAFWVYPRVTTRVKVASDVENVRDLASRVDRSHGVVGSFRGVSTLNVLEDGLAPTDFRQASAATMSNAWGGAVTVSPATVRLAGDAFTVGLSGLPARACVPFVSAIADDVNVRDALHGARVAHLLNQVLGGLRHAIQAFRDLVQGEQNHAKKGDVEQFVEKFSHERGPPWLSGVRVSKKLVVLGDAEQAKRPGGRNRCRGQAERHAEGNVRQLGLGVGHHLPSQLGRPHPRHGVEQESQER